MKQILNKIIQYGLYVLAFLTPFFFLPTTYSPILANKQLMVAVLSGVILLCWIVKVMVTGKIRLKWSRVSTVVVLLLVVLGISTFFSVSKQQSLLGAEFEAGTFFSFILYALVFLLFSNLVKNKTEVLRIVKAFLSGSGILAVLFLLSVVFKGILPWEFAKTVGFNFVGTSQALSIFLGGAFIILMALMSGKTEKTSWKYLIAPIVLGTLFLISVFLVNYWVAWLCMVLAMIVIIWVMLARSGSKDAWTSRELRKLALPLLVLVVGLVFVLIKIPVDNIVEMPSEVSLTYKTTLNISESTISNGVKNFVFGSGPSTFAYDYDLYRSVEHNSTDFWQSRFATGRAFLPTLLATGGVLSVLLAILLLVLFILHGFKTLKPKQTQNQALAQFPSVLLVVIAGGFYFFITWLFYPANFTLMFVTFLMLGLFIALEPDSDKDFSFVQAPQKAFMIMLLCVFLVVGVVVGFYELGKNYVAELAFKDGIELIRGSEADLDGGIVLLRYSLRLKEQDNYFRNLSKALLLKVFQVQDSDISEQDKQVVLQDLIIEINDTTEMAIKVNARNRQNWLNRGDIYAELIKVGVAEADELAISAYMEAKKLSPNYSLIFLKSAMVYVLSADNIKTQIDALTQSNQKNMELLESLNSYGQEKIDLAIIELEKAISLKPNFIEAIQFLEKLTGK